MIAQYAIRFNPEFKRFEVYGPKSQMRNGELQPLFVSGSYMDCHRYVEAVEDEI